MSLEYADGIVVAVGVLGRRGAEALAGLALDDLSVVADALALVGLRRTALADGGGDVADLLLVGAEEDDVRRVRGTDLDARGHRNGHRLVEANVQHDLVALSGGVPTDALDLELLLVSLGHADDHVLDQGARHAVPGADEAVFLGGLGGDLDRVLLDLDVDLGTDLDLELALRSLDQDLAVSLDLDGDAGGDRNGLSADAGHGSGHLAEDLAAGL